MPVRRHTPVMAVPRHHTYSAPRHDYDIDASLQRADFLSHAALEDTYDAASRSRTKDKDLLRNVNSAIGGTFTDTSRPWYLERAAKARSAALEQSPSRAMRGASLPPARSMRGVSLPPRPVATVSQAPQEPLGVPPARWRRASSVQRRSGPPTYDTAVLRARARSLDRGGSLMAGGGQHVDPAIAATQNLVAHRPARLRKDAALLARAQIDVRNPHSSRLRRAASEPRLVDRGEQSHHTYYNVPYPASYKYLYRVPDANEKAMQRHYYSHRGRFGPESKPPRPSLAGFPKVYVPWNGPGPSNRAKAAIIGSKMEPDGRGSRKGPRSQFAQNKMREIRLDDLQRKYN